MYAIAIVGDNVTAWASYRACRLAGFDQVDVYHQRADISSRPAVVTLPACHTKVLHALNCGDGLARQACAPDRQQLRLATSAYLLAELPLGKFINGRYQAPHLNIGYADLHGLLQADCVSRPTPGLNRLQEDYAVVIYTEPAQDTPSTATSGQLWYHQRAKAEHEVSANITWLDRQMCAWQCPSAELVHYYFFSPGTSAPASQRWHPSIQQLADEAQPAVLANQPQVREHWYEGNVVYLGEACYNNSLFLREAACAGLEDAWVLSRMLENYEEDIHDALHQYQTFRRPRLRKISHAAQQQAAQITETSSPKRFLNHLHTAFSTRFLPEIAMQRIDWLYGYDCIRGFR